MPTKKTDPQPDPTPNEDDDDALDPDVEQFANDWGELHTWKGNADVRLGSVEKALEEMKRGSGTAQNGAGQQSNTTPDPQDGQNTQNSGQGQGQRTPRVPTRQPDTAPKSEHRYFRRLGK